MHLSNTTQEQQTQFQAPRSALLHGRQISNLSGKSLEIHLGFVCLLCFMFNLEFRPLRIIATRFYRFAPKQHHTGATNSVPGTALSLTPWTAKLKLVWLVCSLVLKRVKVCLFCLMFDLGFRPQRNIMALCCRLHLRNTTQEQKTQFQALRSALLTG